MIFKMNYIRNCTWMISVILCSSSFQFLWLLMDCWFGFSSSILYQCVDRPEDISKTDDEH